MCEKEAAHAPTHTSTILYPAPAAGHAHTSSGSYIIAAPNAAATASVYSVAMSGTAIKRADKPSKAASASGAAMAMALRRLRRGSQGRAQPPRC